MILFLSNNLQHTIYIRKKLSLRNGSMQLLISPIYFSDWIPLFDAVKNTRHGLDPGGADNTICRTTFLPSFKYLW